MKMRKLLAVVLSMMLCCFLLSGCLLSASEVTIKEDGSGFCTLYIGFTEETYNQMSEAFDEESLEESGEEITKFTYNDEQYIGEVISFDYDNVKELSDTLMLSSQGVESGIIEFAIADGGKLTFTLATTENTGNTEEIKEEALYSEIDEELMKQIEEMVIVYDIDFPSSVKQISGAENSGIIINGNNLLIDVLKLVNELNGKTEKYVFESSVNEESVLSKKDTSFKDVNKGDWYYEQITKMVEQGLFKGKGDKLFCPDDIMTKAEFVTVASRLIYDESYLNLWPGKADIWWDKYYAACTDAGIFTEDELSYNSMTEGMQRQEMALVVFKILEKAEEFDEIDVSKAGENIPDFDKVEDRFKDYVAYCYSLGILCGTDAQGSFNPSGTLTRAEASTVIYRIIDESVRAKN